MNNEILAILHAEQERIVKMLPSLDPTTEGYACALRNLGELQWRTRPDGLPVITPEVAPRPVIVPVVEPEPTPVEPEPTVVPVDEPAPTPAPETDTTDWGAYRVSLRERLADARIKGVDITALLREIGVSKFSSVPDNQLTELSHLLDEALKELT